MGATICKVSPHGTSHLPVIHLAFTCMVIDCSIDSLSVSGVYYHAVGNHIPLSTMELNKMTSTFQAYKWLSEWPSPPAKYTTLLDINYFFLQWRNKQLKIKEPFLVLHLWQICGGKKGTFQNMFVFNIDCNLLIPQTILSTSQNHN